MDIIQSTLKNFSVVCELQRIFSNAHGFEYTKKGIIRSIKLPTCETCGCFCCRNGWDKIGRKDLFSLKVGKFICPICKTPFQSEVTFIHELFNKWEETIRGFFLRLSDRDVALRVISDIMDFLIPISKDTVMRHITSAISKLSYKEFSLKYKIIHYDEQHPKHDRIQKFRLTLIDAITKKVIADKLYDNKDYATVKIFLESNLDTSEEIIFITDDCPWYPTIFKDIWGKKAKHQLCILHLDKLIVNDLGKDKSIQDLYNTYLLLNIFYDRTKELEFLQMLIIDEKEIADNEKSEWLKDAKKRYFKFVRNLEKMRRRSKETHKLSNLEDALNKFNKIKNEKDLFPKELKKRIQYIEKNWERFTLFYSIKDCPHTNNVIENYFSSSLKTHRKKQLRTVLGIENKMKLSEVKRNIGFGKPNITFMQWARMFAVINMT